MSNREPFLSVAIGMKSEEVRGKIGSPSSTGGDETGTFWVYKRKKLVVWFRNRGGGEVFKILKKAGRGRKKRH